MDKHEKELYHNFLAADRYLTPVLCRGPNIFCFLLFVAFCLLTFTCYV